MLYRVVLAIALLHATVHPAFPQSTACDLNAGTLWQPNEGATDYTLHLQPTGELKAVMIFVDFPDAPQSETTSSLYDLLVPNSVNWYAEASYGRMSLNVTPLHAWFTMPQNSAAYGFGDGLTFAEHRAYIADAIAVSDAAVDYSQYQIVYVVASKHSAIGYSPAFHAYSGSGVDADGIEIRHSATFGADIRNVRPNYGSHVLIHETGHLIGLPDLYEWGKPLYEAIRFAGGWDMMSFVTPGAHFLAWHKRKLGWLDPDQVVCLGGSGTVEEILTPVAVEGGVKALVVPLGPSTAYVIESRRKIGQDARLCDEGVLIYSVDARVPNGAGPILLAAAHDGTDPEKIDACGPLYDAPFDLGAGEVASYTDAAAGITVDILAEIAGGYSVRVTRTSSPQPDLIVSALGNPPAVLVLKQKFTITDSTHNGGSAVSIPTTTRYYLSLDAIKSANDKLISGKRAIGGLAAGGTSTAAAQLTIPANTKVGVYRVIACADDLHVEDEADESNNCRTASTTVDVRGPDLVETAVSNPPSSIVRGASFTVTDTAANQGNASTAATTSRYYFSLDTKKTAKDSLLTGTRAVPTLAPGQNSTDSVTVGVPATIAPGTYYLLACADDLKKAAESNELNNCKASATRAVVD